VLIIRLLFTMVIYITITSCNIDVAQAVIIDSFTAEVELQSQETIGSKNITSKDDSILGGERNIKWNVNYDLTPNLQADSSTLGIGGGALVFNNSFGISSSLTIEWNGVNSASKDLGTGLESMDLTDDGVSNAFSFYADASRSLRVTVSIYSSPDDYSTTNIDIHEGTSMNFTKLFSEFADSGGKGADFTSVRAITLSIDPIDPHASSGIRLYKLKTAADEPPILLLLLLLTVFFCRRIKLTKSYTSI